MKKLSIVSTAICMILLSHCQTTLANHSGQHRCEFNKKILKKNGFVSGAYYDAACIKQLLSKLDVKPHDGMLIASGLYRYVCSENHYLATNQLIPNKGEIIYWYNSHPF